ncbi:MAG: hypothetical protein FJY66_02485 [Calditrichaeota bacterium]|nr:hypothetical protein [Calditrichota bacterium]
MKGPQTFSIIYQAVLPKSRLTHSSAEISVAIGRRISYFMWVNRPFRVKDPILTYLTAFLSALFLLTSTAQADEPEGLDSLRRELAAVERKLLQGTFREMDLLEEIDARQRQIALQTQLIREQKKERRGLGDSLRFLEGSLVESWDVLGHLGQEKIALDERRRTVQLAFARHLNAQRRLSRWGTLEFLLKARNLGELFRRRQILSNLHRLEERHLAQLADKSRDLALLQDQIVTHTNHLEGQHRQIDKTRRKALEAERRLRSDQEKLKQQQQILASDLERVRGDRALLERQRLEIQEALRRIEEMVRATRDTSTLAETIPGQSLITLKGFLPWPLQGDVVEYFGVRKQRHSETIMENPGIDIAASVSHEVSCIADGRVAICTWLRGFGNVVIVEHPGDFFTVYGHLQQLAVQRGDEVRAGESLGSAGLDAVSNNYRIHFELWEGKQKQNPLHWLTKR